MILNWIQTNWMAWSLQVLIFSTVGCFVPRLLRLTDPKSRVLGAQFTLLLCLILPFSMPRLAWRETGRVLVTGGAPGPVPGRRIPRKPKSAWTFAIPGLLAAGVMLRMSGLAAGLWKLRGYRRSSKLLTALPGTVTEAFGLTRTCCNVAISDRTHSPATFGLFSPIVMLPKKFPELTRDAQLAIACHELLHVRRNDWLAALIEEFAGGLLWFQPAVYLLIADIRLAREQLVDREVVELTRARTPYVEALLTVAAEPFGAAISMAPMFLHRRNLKSRITFLIEELYMSKTKMVFANVSLAALLGMAGLVSSVTFPLVAVAQEKTEKSAEPQSYDFAKAFAPATGMRIRIGGNVAAANLLTQVKPPYPTDAKAARIQGTVKLGVLIGADGHMSDIVLISGHPLLVQSAVDAVRQWVYRPTLLNGDPVEVVTIVDVNYTLAQ